MERHSRNRTFNQEVRFLTDLLKTYGRLDALAASGTVQTMTECLLLDIRGNNLIRVVDEVTR